MQELATCRSNITPNREEVAYHHSNSSLLPAAASISYLAQLAVQLVVRTGSLQLYAETGQDGDI